MKITYKTSNATSIKRLPLSAQYDIELQEIKKWFDVYYTQHEQKLVRLIALNKLTDEGESPSQALNDLYNLAEEKRTRYQFLEKEIERLNEIVKPIVEEINKESKW